MPISVAARKAKGRKLQQKVVQLLLLAFANLQKDDVVSRGMGQQGEDVQLSPLAQDTLKVSVECKAKNRIAVYKDYEQAVANSQGREPVLVIKQDRSKPLAVVDLEHYIELLAYRRLK